LRFPDFQGEWEEKKVSDILEFFPTNSLSWEQLEYSERELYNLHYGLIHKGLPTQIDLALCALPSIKESNIPNNYTICRNGDVAFADASEDTNDVAKVVEFLDCNEKKIICGLHTIHGRDKLELTVTGFKGYIFSSTFFRNQIRKIAQGTKIYSISTKNFSECYVNIPPKEEQMKIANLLLLIDERISTQIKIIEDLKLLKSTMSQNIFSHKIRFKDENGNVFPNWELKKLNDVLIIQGGYAFKSNLFNQGANKVIRIGDILPIIKLSKFSGTYSSETPNEKYIVKKDDFMMALSGATFGKVGKIKGEGIAYINQRVATFRTKQNLEFFYQLVQTDSFKNYINSIPAASAQPNISNDDIGNYKSYIPHFIEQTKIASFLSTIDKKIEIGRQILNTYTEQKKYLLANLFI